MRDCPNSPDGHHKWIIGVRNGKPYVFCAAQDAELPIGDAEDRLNAAERLNAEQMQVAAMLDNDDIHDILDRKATEAYAARRKDGE